MSRLTAAICCFALSGVFAWISNSATTAALNARAHATQSGLVLMMRQPVSDTGLANFAMFTAIRDAADRRRLLDRIDVAEENTATKIQLRALSATPLHGAGMV